MVAAMERWMQLQASQEFRKTWTLLPETVVQHLPDTFNNMA